ncbi:MAG: alpha/beta hydrolase [Pseudomonadota bacterium]
MMISEMKAHEPSVVDLAYQARVSGSESLLNGLTADAQAGLTSYSLERIVGYGVDYADAVEFRAMVLSGWEWQAAAMLLAERCLADDWKTCATKMTQCYRAAALMRIGQTLMVEDKLERSEVYARATDLFESAATLSGKCEHLQISTPNGMVGAWLYPSSERSIGSVIVHGGIEGWAQDFSQMGEALATRRIDTLMLDGPGQGETRFLHGHYLGTEWRATYRTVIDFLEARAPMRPIGFVGNSMGGSIAMAVTNEDPRISACVNVSGPFAPWLAPQDSPVFHKMTTMANASSIEETLGVFSTIKPVEPGPNDDYRFLLLQGQEDQQIPDEVAAICWEQAPTPNKEMINFSDGDHCIYRHATDRDMVIADWIHAQFAEGVA